MGCAPFCSGIAAIQAPLLNWLRPAQWLCHSLNNASVVWTVLACPNEVARALRVVAHDFNCSVSESPCCLHSSSHFQLFWFTPSCKWLDVIDLTFSPPPSPKFDDSHVVGGTLELSTTIEAKSVSTAVFPASWPLSPALSVIFFWLVFLDHGQNMDHLQRIRGALEDRLGLPISQTPPMRTGATMTKLWFFICVLLTLITVATTIWNSFFNHSDSRTLHVVVTIVCVALTILSIFSFGAAYVVARNQRIRCKTSHAGATLETATPPLLNREDVSV